MGGFLASIRRGAALSRRGVHGAANRDDAGARPDLGLAAGLVVVAALSDPRIALRHLDPRRAPGARWWRNSDLGTVARDQSRDFGHVPRRWLLALPWILAAS